MTEQQKAIDQSNTLMRQSWTELVGYVCEARDEGHVIKPEDLLAYMKELQKQFQAPIKELFVKLLAEGKSTRDIAEESRGD